MITNILMKYLKLAYRIIYIVYRSIMDVYELLHITFKRSEDLDLLGMRIRHLAHILEKTLLNPKREKKYNIYAESNYKELGQLIKKWKIEVGDSTRDIIWAKKIYNEFSKNLETGWYCEYLGNPETELPGVKEIRESNSTNSQTAEIDLLEFLKGRRSIRNWKDKSVPKKQIEIVLEAGTWAPSSCNRQTCKFIVILNKKIIDLVAKAGKGIRTFFHNAPVLIVVINDVRLYQFPEEKHTPYQDAAAAIQNMLLMAHRIGLAACWGSYCSDSAQIKSERKVRRILGIPRCFKITGMVAIGKPNAQVCVVPRKELSKSIIWKP